MTANPATPQRKVGIVFVHGIGEQRRLEHLSAEARAIIHALRDVVGTPPATSDALHPQRQIDVQINDASGSVFLAEQNAWATGGTPSLRVTEGTPGASHCQFNFHEVWWADVNENYSLSKQFRFWLWGLSLWAYPAKDATTLPGASAVQPPVFDNRLSARAWSRVRIFMVGTIFTLIGFSVGIYTFLAKRLFDIDPPKILQTITNYVSGVKLYNQRRRFSGGLWPSDDEFLDTIGEPPRVSIRRRMIRAIAEVACSDDYDEWYILAHSLGTVVAFNGLMETAWAWPGYLDEPLWDRMVSKKLAGPPDPAWPLRHNHTMPQRPIWAGTDVVYRSQIFASFKGLLTYGSPLDKFATIWNARVPISREPAFQPGVPWINVYDPVDPVSGPLDGFSEQPEDCCPHPQNVGYAASNVLLLSHIKYLEGNGQNPSLVRAVASWLLANTPPPGAHGNQIHGRQFERRSWRAWKRHAAAWSQWFAVFIVLSIAGAVVLPVIPRVGCGALTSSAGYAKSIGIPIPQRAWCDD